MEKVLSGIRASEGCGCAPRVCFGGWCFLKLRRKTHQLPILERVAKLFQKRNPAGFLLCSIHSTHFLPRLNWKWHKPLERSLPGGYRRAAKGGQRGAFHPHSPHSPCGTPAPGAPCGRRSRRPRAGQPLPAGGPRPHPALPALSSSACSSPALPVLTVPTRTLPALTIPAPTSPALPALTAAARCGAGPALPPRAAPTPAARSAEQAASPRMRPAARGRL